MIPVTVRKNTVFFSRKKKLALPVIEMDVTGDQCRVTRYICK
jgi:hypothetical protein